ncbi:hypothetical protein [Pedobacter sp. R-06]|uniref:hypothetical protein n=1 Tax=Pedobacter sp. R-06 TaxID=3404051 RepID=UPI003CFB51A7
MKKFLELPKACFYHVTFGANWMKIQKEGLKAKDGKIFLLNSGVFPVIAALCADQIRDKVEKSTTVVLLRLPQFLNNFRFEEIMKDTQASVENNKIFQNFVCRNIILPDHIELVAIFETRWFLLQLDSLAAEANVTLKNNKIGKDALALEYNIEEDPLNSIWTPSDEIKF